MSLKPTSSQTVGPFYHFGLLHDDLKRRAVHGASNEECRISGRVVDGEGAPTADVFLEFWHPSSGFARISCDANGEFSVSLPRPAPDRKGGAAYFSVAIFGRGMLRHLYTRCYLAGDPALEHDAVLTGVPAARRDTIIARADGGRFRFDVVLQGGRETVFFDV